MVQEQYDLLKSTVLNPSASEAAVQSASNWIHVLEKVSVVVKYGIDVGTFYRWCDKDQFLYGSYVRACERLGVALFDRILDEVDSMATVEDSVIASKKIDALKWLSGKLNQKFSDRSDVYIQNVNNTLNANTNELSAADRDKLMKTILSKLNGKIEGIGNAQQLLNE